MTSDLQFDVAFSYSSQDGWAAKDLYQLVSWQGFSVYCYECATDKAGGFLRDNLSDIYRDSRLNVVFWSSNYSEEKRDTLVGMERHVIMSRHVHRGAGQALIIIAMDETPLSRGFDDILAHQLRREGITGLAKILLARLKQVYMGIEGADANYHPRNTEAARGELHPCTFTINKNYKCDPLRRWARLADVLVDFPNPLDTPYVYLIPSGFANPLVRHTAMLKGDRRLLAYKRRAIQSFIEQDPDRQLQGLWFPMWLGDAEVTTIYSLEYDRCLNKSLQEFVLTAGSDTVAAKAGSGSLGS